jgi:hypothetical protein
MSGQFAENRDAALFGSGLHTSRLIAEALTLLLYYILENTCLLPGHPYLQPYHVAPTTVQCVACSAIAR